MLWASQNSGLPCQNGKKGQIYTCIWVQHSWSFKIVGDRIHTSRGLEANPRLTIIQNLKVNSIPGGKTSLTKTLTNVCSDNHRLRSYCLHALTRQLTIDRRESNPRPMARPRMAPEDGEDTTESQRSALFLSGKDLSFFSSFLCLSCGAQALLGE